MKRDVDAMVVDSVQGASLSSESFHTGHEAQQMVGRRRRRRRNASVKLKMNLRLSRTQEPLNPRKIGKRDVKRSRQRQKLPKVQPCRRHPSQTTVRQQNKSRQTPTDYHYIRRFLYTFNNRLSYACNLRRSSRVPQQTFDSNSHSTRYALRKAYNCFRSA